MADAAEALRGRPRDRNAEADASLLAPCRVCGGADRRLLFRKGGRDFQRCTGCGFVWLEPLPTVDELERHYAWTYTEGPYTVFAAADDIRALIARERLAALAGAMPGGPWLDVGASTGAFVAAARAAGHDARGIELSEAASAAARAAGLPVERARLEEWDPPAPLAAVTAFDTIEHLLDPAALPERARRWLIPGGTLVLTLPDVASGAARFLGKRWYFYAPNDHFHYFDRRTIARFLARHGFRVERVARATKPLTLAYVSRQIEVFYPPLAAVGHALRRLPESWLSRTLRVPVGEMLVIARRDG
ncbi:MAG TPA: class I SAM-dependent methyltransferase [Candidatus Binatia bacterium]|nr:class I SAM-dependent methyltransferase [Candidatus Binatia bacterium]